MCSFWCKSGKKVLNLNHFNGFNRTLSYIHRLGKEPLRALTIGKLLDEKSKECSNKIAIISTQQQKKLSFQEVLNKSDRLAAGFIQLGLRQGDKVGIWTPSTVEWYLTHMACARAGLTLVCLNPLLEAKEIKYCINKVGVKAIVCSDRLKSKNNYEILNEVAPELSQSCPGKLKSKAVPSLESVIVAKINNNYKSSFRGAFNFNEVLDLSTSGGVKRIRENQHLIQPDDICHIQFTSGTTGKPKACILTHFNLVNNSYGIGLRNSLEKKDHRICCMVPLFHAFGTSVSVCGSLNHGATLILPSQIFDAEQSLNAIVEEKCTGIYGTPTMFIDLLESQKIRKEKINLDFIMLGAAPATPQLIKDLVENFNVKKISSSYGMSECTAATFQSLPEDSNEMSIDSVGYLEDHLEAKVIDESGRIVPRGVPGELCIRGFSNTIGYWNDPQNTEKLISKDRWLRTGDKFVIREDGYGVIVGRIKDMINRGGENIFPKEIEEHLATHPAVIECHVIGLPHDRLGEEVCACLRLTKGANLTLEEVTRFCDGQLSKFKIPSVIMIVTEFPKTASGKIQKFKLIEMVSKIIRQKV